MTPTDANPHRNGTARNQRVALSCVAVVAAMLGLAYASVPLYRLFCQVTGFAGTTQRAERPASQILDRTVTVRFDGNVGSGLDWDFAPLVTTMQVRLGETALATYRATNRSDRALVGSSTFNVAPDQAGAFFNKLECFCFTEQRLEPGQSIDMPVSFFVDPAMVTDTDGAHIRLITLSYTFYPVATPQKVGASEKPAPTPERGS